MVRPTLSVTTHSNGSNIEDLVAALQSPTQEADEGSPSQQNNLSVEIVDGTIRGYDAETQKLWLLNEANVSTKSVESGQLEVVGDARLSISPESQPGRVKFSFLQNNGQLQQIDLLTEQLPVEPFELWLRRAVPGCRLVGTMSADAKLSWVSNEQGQPTLKTVGRIDANDVGFTAEVLAGDQLSFERLEAPWRVNIDPEGIAIEHLEAKSEWASLIAKGTLTVEEMKSIGLQNLPKRPMEFAGRVQLARLAAMCPNTLQLKEGVKISSGELAVTASSKSREEGFGWSVAMTAQDLAGSNGQQSLRWDEPIKVTVDLVDLGQGPLQTELGFQSSLCRRVFHYVGRQN